MRDDEVRSGPEGPGRHIVLVGPMGVGKSTIGRLLAAEIDRPFLDSDIVLETLSGMSASAIAARDGVDRLHELELEVFLEMCRAATPSVIAPAASVVDSGPGRHSLARHLTVWLTAPDAVIAERQTSGSHRRSIDPTTRGSLAAERATHLETVSRLTFSTGAGTPVDLVSVLVDSLAALVDV